MIITFAAIITIGLFAAGMGVAWQVFKPRGVDALARWSILYIDHDARMQRTAARITSVHPVERRLMASCTTEGRARVFKVSKIVEARDLETGMPVDVAQWVESFATAR